MTNKLTVPSELIHRAIDAIEQVGYQDKFIDYTFVRAVKQELRAALADPVPPAGGEPGVRAAFDAWFIHDRALDPQTDTTLIDGPFEPWRAWKACADQYSAHVTQLQAEVERLTAQKADAVAVVDETDDGLFIEIIYGDGGSSLRRGDKLYTAPSDRGYVSRLAYDALQAELTKAREHNKELSAMLLKVRDSEIHEGRLLYDSITKLVANQSVPADKGQGEPVARVRHSPVRKRLSVELLLSNMKDGDLLYAEQPAPVAVVMPERLQEIHEFLNGSGTLDGYSFGSSHPSGRKYWWRNELRACLDEVARLNSEPKP